MATRRALDIAAVAATAGFSLEGWRAYERNRLRAALAAAQAVLEEPYALRFKLVVLDA